MISCAIRYHTYNLKSKKNTHGGVLLKPALLLTLLHGCFSRFSNCANGTKSCKASHLNLNFEHLNLNSLEFREHVCETSFINVSNLQSSYRMHSLKNDVLKNFPRFSGKQLCQSIFFNKVAGRRLQFF